MKTNPNMLALALFIGALILYMGVISPLSLSNLKARSELMDLEGSRNTITIALAQQSDIVARAAELEKKNVVNRTKWMVPMLHSYGMRAKSLLDEMAQEAGLTNMEYEEGEFRALPIPKEQLPEHRTGRRTVRMKATADYAALISFLLRAESEMPLMTLQALTIEASKMAGAGVDVQDAVFTFEWPCEGEVIK